MAAIILPHRWTRQPQGPSRVDWSNPLAKDLIVAWNAAFPAANAVTGRPAVLKNGIAPGDMPGQSLKFEGTAGSTACHYVSIPWEFGFLAAGGGMSLVSIYQEQNPIGSYRRHLRIYNGGSERVRIFHELTGASLGYRVVDGIGGGIDQRASVGSVAADGVYAIGISYPWGNSVTGHRIRDSAYISSTTGASGNPTPGVAVATEIGINTDDNYQPGRIDCSVWLLWNRNLEKGELESAVRFPWQFFAPLRRRLYFFSAGGAGAISADAALLEANDTLSASTTATISATANIAEDNDTSSSGATVAIAATAALGESADALAAEGTVAFPGVTATATLAESDDALTSAVSVVLTGTASLAEANDALAASGAVAITAAAALLEANDALTSEGGTASFAAATIEEASDGLTATGTVLVTGAAAIAEAADALASAVTVSLTANAALLEANDLLSASGSVGNVVRTADAALVEAPDQASATAAVTVTGAAAIIEAGDIVVSGVTVLVTANAALVEENDGLTSSGTAMFGVFADAALQEANDVLTSAVVQKIARRIAASDALRGGIAASDAGRWTITSSDGLN